MLDTNTCAVVLRGEADRIVGRFNRHADHICISSIVLAELHYGVEKSQRISDNLDRLEQFVSRLAVLDFDAAAALEFGRIQFALRQSPIGTLDTLIAAHALSRDLTVVTANVDEFARVPGLRVETWL
jgi:tRNA(fMet)-specific endonuclease VapC